MIMMIMMMMMMMKSSCFLHDATLLHCTAFKTYSPEVVL